MSCSSFRALVVALAAVVSCKASVEISGNHSAVAHASKENESAVETIIDELEDLMEKAHLEDVHRWEKEVIVPIVSMYMFAFMVSNILHVLKINFFPESMVFVVCGAVLGFVAQHVYGDSAINNELTKFLDTLILNIILLPVIIFESGWSLNRRDFMSQLGYICTFAIAGTVISMLVVAACMIFLQGSHERDPVAHWRTALAYASLISAVDPVATLSTYTHLNVQPLLNVLVFGESVINDAVAIALFKVINDDQVWGDGSDAQHIFWRVVLGVVWNMLGSILLAVFLGTIYVLIIRFTHMRHSPSFVILFVFFSCFFTFSVAESVCNLSGIISVLFSAMFLNAFVRPHVSVECMLLTSFFLKQTSTMMDMAVFFFIGVAVAEMDAVVWAWSGWLMLFCLAGRAAAVFPLGGVCNLVKKLVSKRLPAEKRHMITLRHMVAMWHAGLRGGIALALCFELGDWVDVLEGAGTRRLLQHGTVVMICVFLLVFGGSTELSLKCLGIPSGEEVDSSELLYNMDDQHGLGWRSLEWVYRQAATILVGGAAEERNDLKMHGGIMGALLKEAKIIEKAHESVLRDDSRSDTMRVRMRAASERDEMMALFGSNDPTGVRTMAAIQTALREDPCQDPASDDDDSDESDLANGQP